MTFSSCRSTGATSVDGTVCGDRLMTITCSSQVSAGQLITEVLLGESVRNKGAAGMRGTTSKDISSKRSVVEGLYASGGDGELARF